MALRRIANPAVLMVELTIAALACFGVWMATHAIWVVAHGGNQAFDAAFDYPGWAIVHFASGLGFVVILPMQLWERVRDAHPRLHRLAGRTAATCGAGFAVTGFALPFVMPDRPFGERAFMTSVASLFAFLLWSGVSAARRGDFVSHRRWMLRVTAAALGPITERLIFPFFAAAGIDSIGRFWDLFVTALWFSLAINLAIAEWWIQRSAVAEPAIAA